MRMVKVVILMILLVAGNIACRMNLSHDTPCTSRSDGEYHVFERGIDDVGIIVENTLTTTFGSASQTRHQTNHGKVYNTPYKHVVQHFGNILSKTIVCRITSSSKPRTLYYIFALHRMRN